MKIKRKLPEPPRPATRATFKKEVVGDGKYTRTIDKPQKLHMTPGKWPRSKPKAKKATEPKNHKTTLRKIENTKKVLELYDKGYSTDEIMNETGFSQTTVLRYIRSNRERRYMPYYKHDAEITKMFNEGVSIMDMSKRLGVPDYYVKNVIRRLRNYGKIGWRFKKWEEKALSE